MWILKTGINLEYSYLYKPSERWISVALFKKWGLFCSFSLSPCFRQKEGFLQYWELYDYCELKLERYMAHENPPKVKFFIWRACKGFLPVRWNLCKRNMRSDAVCPRCGFEKETIFHAIVSCPAAIACWFVSPLSLRRDQSINGSFADWFFSLNKKLDHEQMCIVAMVSWSINHQERCDSWFCREKSFYGCC